MEQLSSHKISRLYILYIVIILAGFIANFAWFDSGASFGNGVLKLTPERVSGRKDNLNRRMLKGAVPDSSAFEARIGGRDFARAGAGDYAVLVYQLNCQAYSIYFNDTFLGSVGDMQTGRSNIRNSMNCFFIAKSSLRRENELKINIRGRDDTGPASGPVYIVDAANLNRYLGRGKFFSQDIHWLSIGLTIFGGMMIWMLFLTATPPRISSLYFFLHCCFGPFSPWTASRGTLCRSAASLIKGW
jgi:hypothetical protein